MPYVSCPRCALRSYSAARYAGSDDCPGCGCPLAPAPSRRPAVAIVAVDQTKRLAEARTRDVAA